MYALPRICAATSAWINHGPLEDHSHYGVIKNPRAQCVYLCGSDEKELGRGGKEEEGRKRKEGRGGREEEREG